MAPEILMPVYNTLEHDPRVQRTAQSLSTEYNITILCLRNDGGKMYSPSSYSVRRVSSNENFPLFSHLYFWMVMCFYSIIKQQPDIIHAHDYFTIAPCRIIFIFFDVQIVYDAHELLVGLSEDKRDRRSKIWYRLEKFGIKRADLVIAANHERAHIMKINYRLSELPVVIRNISDESKVNKSQWSKRELESEARSWLDNNTYIKIVYQGYIGGGRRIDQFVKAMEDIESNYKLIIIGDGPKSGELKRLVKTNNLDAQVSFQGKLPHDKMMNMLEKCDIGIVTYPCDDLNNLFCAPNKIYEYSQTGLAMIGNDNPKVKDLIEGNRIGEAVDESIIDTMYSVGRKLNLYQENSKCFNRNNTWGDEANKLKESYESISNGL